jgi:ribosomal protein S18 acetylase RimI-like enzyme
MIEKDIKEVARLYIELEFYIKEQTQDDYFDFEAIKIYDISGYIDEKINDKDHKIVIARQGSQIIGFLSGQMQDCYLPVSSIKRIGYIQSGYVKEGYMNKKIAKGMLKRLETFFNEKDVKYIELDIMALNLKAKKAWIKLGFSTFREHMRKKI